jgi:hypothetical protein
MHLFTRVSLSVKMNMFGHDDDALNNVLMGLVANPSVLIQVTLDRSQAGGPTEKAILGSAVYVNPYEIAKFAARLDYEHAVAASQPRPNLAAPPAAAPAT